MVKRAFNISGSSLLEKRNLNIFFVNSRLTPKKQFAHLLLTTWKLVTAGFPRVRVPREQNEDTV